MCGELDGLLFLGSRGRGLGLQEVAMSAGLGSSGSGTVHLNLPSRGCPDPRPRGMCWLDPLPGKGFKSG